MLSKNALGNLVNRYKAVLKKCHLLNTFGSFAVATIMTGGTVMMAPSLADAETSGPSQARDTGSAYYFYRAGGGGLLNAVEFGSVTFLNQQYKILATTGTEYTLNPVISPEDAHFTMNTGVVSGGAAIYKNFQVTVNGIVPEATPSVILENGDTSSTNFYLSTREGNGGALMTQTGATIGEISGNFIGSQARGDAAASLDGHGGAIYNRGNVTSITGNFIGNKALGGGGAIWSDAAIDTLIADFIGNTAGTDGGAIYTTSGITNLQSDFIANAAANNGGALYIDGGVLTSISGNFINNTAGGLGGAIYTSGDLTFEANGKHFVISGNSDSSDDVEGNAIHFKTTDNTDIKELTFTLSSGGSYSLYDAITTDGGGYNLNITSTDGKNDTGTFYLVTSLSDELKVVNLNNSTLRATGGEFQGTPDFIATGQYATLSGGSDFLNLNTLSVSDSDPSASGTDDKLTLAGQVKANSVLIAPETSLILSGSQTALNVTGDITADTESVLRVQGSLTAQNVNMGAGFFEINTASTATVDTVSVSASEVDKGLRVHGTLTTNSSGSVTIGSGGVLNIMSGSTGINGMLDVSSGGLTVAADAQTFANDGTLKAQADNFDVVFDLNASGDAIVTDRSGTVSVEKQLDNSGGTLILVSDFGSGFNAIEKDVFDDTVMTDTDLVGADGIFADMTTAGDLQLFNTSTGQFITTDAYSLDSLGDPNSTIIVLSTDAVLVGTLSGSKPVTVSHILSYNDETDSAIKSGAELTLTGAGNGQGESVDRPDLMKKGTLTVENGGKLTLGIVNQANTISGGLINGGAITVAGQVTFSGSIQANSISPGTFTVDNNASATFMGNNALNTVENAGALIVSGGNTTFNAGIAVGTDGTSGSLTVNAGSAIFGTGNVTSAVTLSGGEATVNVAATATFDGLFTTSEDGALAMHDGATAVFTNSGKNTVTLAGSSAGTLRASGIGSVSVTYGGITKLEVSDALANLSIVGMSRDDQTISAVGISGGSLYMHADATITDFAASDGFFYVDEETVLTNANTSALSIINNISSLTVESGSLSTANYTDGSNDQSAQLIIGSAGAFSITSGGSTFTAVTNDGTFNVNDDTTFSTSVSGGGGKIVIADTKKATFSGGADITIENIVDAAVGASGSLVVGTNTTFGGGVGTGAGNPGTLSLAVESDKTATLTKTNNRLTTTTGAGTVIIGNGSQEVNLNIEGVSGSLAAFNITSSGSLSLDGADNTLNSVTNAGTINVNQNTTFASGASGGGKILIADTKTATFSGANTVENTIDAEVGSATIKTTDETTFTAAVGASGAGELSLDTAAIGYATFLATGNKLVTASGTAKVAIGSATEFDANLTITGANNTLADFKIFAEGTLIMSGAGNILGEVNNTGTIDLDANTKFSGAVDGAEGSKIFLADNVTSTFSGAGSITVLSDIEADAGATGVLDVQGGTYFAGAVGANGGSLSLVVADGKNAKFSAQGNKFTTVSGSGTVELVQNTGADLSITGNGATIAADFIINDADSGGSADNATTLNITGAGNTFEGLITNNGTLNIAASGTSTTVVEQYSGSGALSISADNTLDMNMDDVSLGEVTNEGTLKLTGGGITTFTEDITGAAGTLSIGSGETAKMSGATSVENKVTFEGLTGGLNVVDGEVTFAETIGSGSMNGTIIAEGASSTTFEKAVTVGTLSVTGLGASVTLNGDNNSFSDLENSGSISIHGDTTLKSVRNTNALNIHAGTTTFKNDISDTGTLTVEASGSAIFDAAMNVTNKVNYLGTVTVKADTVFEDTVSGGGTLNISGSTSVTLEVANNTLGVVNNESGTLYINGNTDLEGRISGAGTVVLGNDVIVSARNDLTIENKLSGDSTSTLSVLNNTVTLTASGSTVGFLHATQNSDGTVALSGSNASLTVDTPVNFLLADVHIQDSGASLTIEGSGGLFAGLINEGDVIVAADSTFKEDVLGSGTLNIKADKTATFSGAGNSIVENMIMTDANATASIEVESSTKFKGLVGASGGSLTLALDATAEFWVAGNKLDKVTSWQESDALAVLSGASVEITGTGSKASVSISSGGHLIMSGADNTLWSVVNSATIDVNADTTFIGDIVNAHEGVVGTLNVKSGADMIVSGGMSVANNVNASGGLVLKNASDSVTFTGAETTLSAITNNGSITTQSANTTLTQGYTGLSGTSFTVGSGGASAVTTLTSGGFTLNDGAGLTVAQNGVLDVSGGTLKVASGASTFKVEEGGQLIAQASNFGTFTQDGTFTRDTTNINHTLTSAGNLTLTGLTFNIAKGDAATYDKLLGEALTFTGGTGTITFDMEMDEVYSLTTVPTTFVQPDTVVTAGNLVGGTDVNILRVESNGVTHSTVDSASTLTIGQNGTADGTLMQGTMNNSGKLTLGSGIMQDTFQNFAGGTTHITGATTFNALVTNDSGAISVASGASATFNGLKNENSGSLSVADGGTVTLSGAGDANNYMLGNAVTNEGKLIVNTSDNLNITAAIGGSGSLTVNTGKQGSLQVAGAFTNSLANSGRFSVVASGATFKEAVTNDGTLHIGATGTTFEKAVTNDGSVNVNETDTTFMGGIISSEGVTDSVLDISAEGVAILDDESELYSVLNGGKIIANAQTTFNVNTNVGKIENNGGIEVNAVNVQFNEEITYGAGATASGSLTVNSGAAAVFLKTTDLAVVTNNGSMEVSGGGLTFTQGLSGASGSLTIHGLTAASFTQANGIVENTVTNNGALHVEGATTFSNTINNNSAITVNEDATFNGAVTGESGSVSVAADKDATFSGADNVIGQLDNEGTAIIGGDTTVGTYSGGGADILDITTGALTLSGGGDIQIVKNVGGLTVGGNTTIATYSGAGSLTITAGTTTMESKTSLGAVTNAGTLKMLSGGEFTGNVSGAGTLELWGTTGFHGKDIVVDNMVNTNTNSETQAVAVTFNNTVTNGAEFEASNATFKETVTNNGEFSTSTNVTFEEQVLNDGTFTVNRNTTFKGGVSGSGSLTVSGGGIATLQGTSTFGTGQLDNQGTVISDGTLNLTGGYTGAANTTLNVSGGTTTITGNTDIQGGTLSVTGGTLDVSGTGQALKVTEGSTFENSGNLIANAADFGVFTQAGAWDETNANVQQTLTNTGTLTLMGLTFTYNGTQVGMAAGEYSKLLAGAQSLVTGGTINFDGLKLDDNYSLTSAEDGFGQRDHVLWAGDLGVNPDGTSVNKTVTALAVKGTAASSIASGSSLTLVGGEGVTLVESAMTNSGTLILGTGTVAGAYIASGATALTTVQGASVFSQAVNNEGTFTIDSGASAAFGSGYTGAGTLTLNGSVTGALDIQTGGTLEVNTDLNVASGSGTTLAVASGSTFTAANGVTVTAQASDFATFNKTDMTNITYTDVLKGTVQTQLGGHGVLKLLGLESGSMSLDNYNALLIGGQNALITGGSLLLEEVSVNTENKSLTDLGDGANLPNNTVTGGTVGADETIVIGSVVKSDDPNATEDEKEGNVQNFGNLTITGKNEAGTSGATSVAGSFTNKEGANSTFTDETNIGGDFTNEGADASGSGGGTVAFEQNVTVGGNFTNASGGTTTFEKDVEIDGDFTNEGAGTAGASGGQVDFGNNLDVDGDFNAGEGSTTKVTGNADVGGDFNAGEGSTTEVAGNADVGGDFNAGEGSTTKVTGNADVGGDFNAGAGSTTEVAGNAAVGKDLTVGESGSMTLGGENNTVGGNVVVKEDAILDVPNNKELQASGGLTMTAGSTIRVGTAADGIQSDTGGKLSVAGEVNLNGGTLALDPAWVAGEEFEDAGKASQAALEKFSATGINGNILVGQKSQVSLGTKDVNTLAQNIADYEKAANTQIWGSGGVTAALGIYSAQTLAANGAIYVDGAATTWDGTTWTNAGATVTHTVAADTALFGANSLLVVDASNASLVDDKGTTVKAALTAASGTGTLSVSKDAKLLVIGAAVGDELTVTTGFTTSNIEEGGWGYTTQGFNGDNLLFENSLMQATTSLTNNSYLLTISLRESNNPLLDGQGNAFLTAVAQSPDFGTDSLDAGMRYYSRILSGQYLAQQALGGADNRAQAVEFESSRQLAALSAVGATGMDVVSTAAGATTSRNSFIGLGGNPNGGGSSVSMDANGDVGLNAGNAMKNGVGVWLMPLYKWSSVSGIDTGAFNTGYTNSLGGIALGVDYTVHDAVRVGLAFNVGAGFGESSGDLNETKNDFNFWGLSLYAGYQKDNFAASFDIGYSAVYNDLTQETNALMQWGNNEASVTSDVWTVGLNLEYKIETDYLDIIPHAGVRYMGVTTQGYDIEGGGGTIAEVDADHQSVWYFPVGVTFSNDVDMENGWTFTPKLDLGFIAAAGDMKADSRATTQGIAASTDYSIKNVDGFAFNGGVGFDIGNENVKLGLNYNLQASEHETGHMVNATFRYEF